MRHGQRQSVPCSWSQTLGEIYNLKALTDGNRFLRTGKLGSTLFFVRRMSNDDVPDSLIELVNSLDPETTLV